MQAPGEEVGRLLQSRSTESCNKGLFEGVATWKYHF
jgi:hypothetical protein